MPRSVRARRRRLLLFASVLRYDLHALHAAAVEHAAPARVVGASTAGSRVPASIERGCVAALLPGEGLSFGIAHVEWDPADPVGSARTAADLARTRAGEHATTPRCCCSPMA